MLTVESILKELYADEGGGAEVQVYVEVSTFRDTPELQTLLKFMEALQYNEYDGKKVVKALKKLINPREIRSIRFGREASPVFYIQVSHANLDEKTRHLNEGRLSPDDLQKRKARIEKMFKDINADELNYDGDTLRVWFD